MDKVTEEMKLIAVAKIAHSALQTSAMLAERTAELQSVVTDIVAFGTRRFAAEDGDKDDKELDRKIKELEKESETQVEYLKVVARSALKVCDSFEELGIISKEAR